MNNGPSLIKGAIGNRKQVTDGTQPTLMKKSKTLFLKIGKKRLRKNLKVTVHLRDTQVKNSIMNTIPQNGKVGTFVRSV